MPLSDIQIRNLKPRDKAYNVSDFEGLYVLVKVNGSKLWQFKYRLHGKERLLSIGIYPDVTLAQARKAKEEARAKVTTGTDPSEAKQSRLRNVSNGKKRAKPLRRLAQNFFINSARKESRRPHWIKLSTTSNWQTVILAAGP